MVRHELLSPAGNMECLKQAVYNGADAVYISCKNFGARKFATNFTDDEIIVAIKLCHLYGVRLYVTMNTLVKNNEVDDFLKQAYFLHKNGVDALIVQDFGMICLLREKYPNLEIHASTQANTSSSETCQLFYDLGVKRVVFSRELSIDEIDAIDVPIEKEAFIHGALCISYSGCCLMSSMLGGRSGNRGECTGSCRLPFSLKKGSKTIVENKYLLSTKELNTSSNISRLKNSSIYSFKIEGRMKSPLYVGFITRMYRKLIDGEEFNLEEETAKLKTIFNREFTKGRLFHENDKNLMNIKSPNHVGLKIGKVVEVKNNKLKIELTDGYSINQYDAIRFLNSNKGMIVNFLYDKKMQLANSSKNICYVDNKVGLDKLDIVTKTQDVLLNNEYQMVDKRKVFVTFKVKAKLNQELLVEITDGDNTFMQKASVITQAINAPTNKEMIIKQLNKLGDTPFICNDFEIDMDENIFIQVRVLNEVRRYLVEKLIECRENKKCEVLKKEVIYEKNLENNLLNKNLLSCFVYTKEQLDTCLLLGVDRIYTANKELYDLYKDNDHVFFAVSRCSNNIGDKLQERNLVSDYMDFRNNNIIGNYSLNVTNIYTAYYLRKIGLETVPLSVELTDLEISEFIDLYRSKFGFTLFEILSYGRVQNMIIKGNILDIERNSYEYNLIDSRGREFPVYYDGVNTCILNYCNISREKFDYTIRRLDFYLEDVGVIKDIVNKYQ